MNIKNAGWVVLTTLLAGCVGLVAPPATVQDGVIENPNLGVSGFRFEIPARLFLYEPSCPIEPDDTLRQAALRVYETNQKWHPRGNEQFYESFLLLGERSAFLLITLTVAAVIPFDDDPFIHTAKANHPVLPLYNRTESREVRMDGVPAGALLTRGYAYEGKGWIYDRPGKNRALFNYEACTIESAGGIRCVLMGMALPEHAGDLTLVMQQMVDTMRL